MTLTAEKIAHEKWVQDRVKKNRLRISVTAIMARNTLRFIENETLGNYERNIFNYFK